MALMGDFSDLSLSDLLYIFNLRRMTGRLTVQSGDSDATLYFQRGKLAYVTSPQTSQHLGQLLIRLGKLTLEQLSAALTIQASAAATQPIGDILVAQGAITMDDLDEALTYQAEEVLYHVLSWPDGTFSFAASDTSSLRLPLRDFNIERVILEATRRADEWVSIRTRIPSLDCGVILLDTPTGNSTTDRPRLTENIFIASIMEGATTLRQIGSVSGLTEDDLLRITYDLANREILAITHPPGTHSVDVKEAAPPRRIGASPTTYSGAAASPRTHSAPSS